jgi:hypothetical protein
MAGWRARIDLLTPAGAVRTWEHEAEASTAEASKLTVIQSANGTTRLAAV